MVHWTQTELWLVEEQEKGCRDDQHKGKLAMALQATPLKDDHSYFSEGVQTKQTNINQTELKTKTDMVHWSRTELWLVGDKKGPQR